MTPRKVIIPQKTGNVSTAAARKAVEVVMREQPDTNLTVVRSGNERLTATKLIEQYLGKFGTSLGTARQVKVHLSKQPGMTIKLPKVGSVRIQSPVVRVQSSSRGLAAKVAVKKARGR